MGKEIMISAEDVEEIKKAYKEMNDERTKLYGISGLLMAVEGTDTETVLESYQSVAVGRIIDDYLNKIAEINDTIMHIIEKTKEVEK